MWLCSNMFMAIIISYLALISALGKCVIRCKMLHFVKFSYIFFLVIYIISIIYSLYTGTDCGPMDWSVAKEHKGRAGPLWCQLLGPQKTATSWQGLTLICPYNLVSSSSVRHCVWERLIGFCVLCLLEYVWKGMHSICAPFDIYFGCFAFFSDFLV